MITKTEMKRHKLKREEIIDALRYLIKTVRTASEVESFNLKIEIDRRPMRPMDSSGAWMDFEIACRYRLFGEGEGGAKFW